MLIDYLNITEAYAAEICVKNCEDFGLNELSIDEVMKCFYEGSKLIKRTYGFAIVRPEMTQKGTTSFLHFLFIDPTQRGAKNGRRFMRELLKEFSKKYIMYLVCYGSDRRRFFGKVGFCIESRDQNGKLTMKSKDI